MTSKISSSWKHQLRSFLSSIDKSFSLLISFLLRFCLCSLRPFNHDKEKLSTLALCCAKRRRSSVVSYVSLWRFSSAVQRLYTSFFFFIRFDFRVCGNFSSVGYAVPPFNVLGVKRRRNMQLASVAISTQSFTQTMTRNGKMFSLYFCACLALLCH